MNNSKENPKQENIIKTILNKLSIKQKIFFSSILIVIALCLCVFIILSRYPKKSRSFLYFENSLLPAENLLALNDKAVSGNLSFKDYAFYKFSKGQKKQLISFYQKNNQAALRIGLAIKNVSYEKLIEYSDSEKAFFYGFLYEEDFNDNGKFTGEIAGRILGSADLRSFIKTDGENGKSYLDVSIAMEKSLDENKIPCGFLIYTSLPLKILGVLIETAKIGYDLTGKVPLWALPSNGGKIGDMTTLDFTGAVNVFPTVNSSRSIMPKIQIQITDNPELEEDVNNKRISLNAGGEILTFYRFKDKNTFTLQTSMLSKPFSTYSMSDKNAIFSKILMVSNDQNLIPDEKNKVLEAIPTDPGLLPKSKMNSWRTPDYELYKWEGKENILLFDTKNYNIQSKFFTRLAFFVEKAGYKGKLLTDEEIGKMHGYNAHDYKSENLADFFNQADKRPGLLNEKEELLKEILLHNGIINYDGDKYTDGKGALISISQESADYLRQSLCAHEIWHGLYFTDEDFRNTTAAIYYTIDPLAIDFLKGYWTSNPSLGYDTTDSYLVQNEFMAYIMQNQLNNVANYFIHIANFNSSRRDIPVQSNYVIQTNARAFEDAALAFTSYVQDRWGLECGRVALITR